MDAKKHKDIVTQILENLGNQGLVSGLLLELGNDNTESVNLLATNVTNITELTENNKDLLSANNKLFRQLGAEEKETEKIEETEEVKNDKTEVIDFTNLFNEKGELK